MLNMGFVPKNAALNGTQALGNLFQYFGDQGWALQGSLPNLWKKFLNNDVLVLSNPNIIGLQELDCFSTSM